MKILAYTYYNSPWKMESGDDVRIHTILVALAKSSALTAFNLSSVAKTSSRTVHDNVVYMSLPRKLYSLLSTITRWNMHYDLNPLIKITHYVDELVTAIKLHKDLEEAKVILVFGSMSLFSFFSRMLGVKSIILYDPLANYAQTLYLRSRKSLLGLLRYGLYLSLHKLEVNAADVVVYPSKIDLENSIRMFKPRKQIIIPNVPPICYESINEYMELRARRKDFDRPYFILLAGGRGKNNEEAVKIAIEVFNELPPDRFKLLITGPWQDMKKYVENPSIELLGVVPKNKLKELLAISDYGLSPVFSHSAGTSLKVLAYLSAGLEVIASPHSVIGIRTIHYSKVYVVRSKEEFSEVMREVINSRRLAKAERPLVKLCSELYRDLNKSLSQLSVPGLKWKIRRRRTLDDHPL